MRAPRIEKGLVLDGFTLTEPVKQGGMAALWRVEKPGLAMPLVMKIPLILDGDDPTMIVGFEMEQMILPRLSGPHVPRFVANGDFATQPYIVMEFVEGASLFEKVAKAPLPETEVLALGARLASALSDLHRQNVIHLDIKPANVIERADGRLVLVDFGLARHLRLPDLLQEEFRVPMGTAPYIAPEQVLRARDDPRSDLFALGVLLYELATGRQPFGDPRGTAKLRRRLWDDPVRPRALRPELSQAFQEIVMRALQVDPAERFPTADQMAFALKHPTQVPLTQRGQRLTRYTPLVRFKRWLKATGQERVPARPIAEGMAEAPIIIAAIDLSDDFSDVAEGVKAMAARMLKTMPEARLACVNVLKTKRIGIDDMLDEEGRALHVTRLVELKAWAETFKLPPERLTFHVLEHPDPAAAIVAHARDNRADQIVMGARAHSTTRRYLGSVSAQVAAEAPCTVTVVRVAGREEEAGNGS